MKKWNEIEGSFDFGEATIIREISTGKIYLEVGVLNGRSSANASDVAMHVHAVDTYMSHPNGIYQFEKYTNLQIVQDNLRGRTNITFWPGKSDFIATHFEDESIDVIFIDGSHTYEGVSLDIRSWWSKLKYGGKMAFHDYGQGFPGVTLAFNEFFGIPEIRKDSTAIVTKKEQIINMETNK